MFYIYLTVSAALILIGNNFINIMRGPYSWWLAPLLLIGLVAVFYIIQFAAVILIILTTDVKKPLKGNGKLFRFLLKYSLPIIVKAAGVRFNAQGLDKVPPGGRMLFVCNHQHNFDCVIMLYAFPDAELAFIGKKEIYTTMPFIAKAMHRLKSLPIDRENDREAAKTIIKAIKLIKDDEASVALFPEGYANKAGELQPLRNGSLKVAIKSQAPIVVCVLDNTPQIQKNMFRRKTVVDFRVLDIISPESFEDMNTAQLGEIIHTQMQNALDDIRNKK
ncbi:MAG: 1-acyl-sn-glycerol-3-phosphate acyltransferase [Clostridia bacterium]|nr:1-acyl-sn-glycerol-3-phosphate acyltransferase [Clostridia bacterium]